MVDAWVTDAQVLDDSSAVRRIENSVLLRTSAVEQFLDVNRPSAALVAPKGFGKTFILKVKRLQLENAGAHCLPYGNIVDRPFARAPTLALDTITLLSASGSWQSIWEIAIAVSVLRADRSKVPDLDPDKMAVSIKSDVLNDLFSTPEIDTPFEVVDYLLRLPRKGLIKALDSCGEMVSHFTKVRARTALFIDNIDEYVDDYLKSHRSLPSEKKTSFSNLWNSAQIGAWLAIRQLQGVNPHVRVFFTLRKEAYHHAQSSEPLFSNLDGAFSVELRYDPDDLIAIVENNIRVEKPNRMMYPERNDLLMSFVGRDASTISNTGTGAAESIINYWLRHCVGRPRDVVSIGGKISQIDPAKRTGAAVRGAINSAAAAAVTMLTNESQHHLGGFRPGKLAEVLPSNVLSRAELEVVSTSYEENFVMEKGTGDGSEGHAFCTLYALGLLGVLREDQNEPGRFYQDFPSIGEYPVDRAHVLPRADYYFLHPAFSDYVIARDATFVGKLHRFNIIGQGKTWREPTDYVFVIVADMAGYREGVMNRPGPSRSFPKFWDRAFGRSTRDLQHSERSGGDSFVLADTSPRKILNACRSLATQLRSSEFNLHIRAGGHTGFWRLHDVEAGDPGISEIVGTAARIEPYAEKGSLLVSEQFYKGVEATQNRDLIGEFSPMAEAQPDESGLTISKPHEPLETVRLFRVTL